MQAVEKVKQPITELAEFYNRVRAHTERLCEPLEVEDYIPQPTVDVSPPKWNIAHTSWFFEEMILKKFVPDFKPFDERFGFLFNSYYNSVGKRVQRDDRGSLSRPTVSEVFAYRRHVDEQMSSLLETDLAPEARDLVILGLNHEQQHQELFLTDLKYTLSLNPLFPAYRENYAPEEEERGHSCPPSTERGQSRPPSTERGHSCPPTTERGHSCPLGAVLEIEAGIYEIGFNGDGFCFDNELSRHKVFLDDFSIHDQLVTNAEFVEFIKAGGYRDFNLWHSEGWDWVNQNEIRTPLYWESNGDEWSQFTLGGMRPLAMDAPVCHVSFYEAAAFAEWKGMRLPTEAEWEIASDKLDWGTRWEWTNSAYLPYPGFSKAAGAVGEYNGKFMINQMVLRGASAVTPAGHSRPTYRNFFHPHLRWQFTGIRLVK